MVGEVILTKMMQSKCIICKCPCVVLCSIRNHLETGVIERNSNFRCRTMEKTHRPPHQATRRRELVRARPPPHQVNRRGEVARTHLPPHRIASAAHASAYSRSGPPIEMGSHAEWMERQLLDDMAPEDKWKVAVAHAPKIPRRSTPEDEPEMAVASTSTTPNGQFPRASQAWRSRRLVRVGKFWMPY